MDNPAYKLDLNMKGDLEKAKDDMEPVNGLDIKRSDGRIDDFEEISLKFKIDQLPEKSLYPDVNMDGFGKAEKQEEEGVQFVHLKRRVGLFSGTALIIGSMIGSGIFISPGHLFGKTQSVSVGLLVWFGCGILSILGGLSYVELGAVLPKNGGEFVYFYESMKDLHPFFGPLPAFLFGWVSIFLLRPASFAIVSLAFAKYSLTPIWDRFGHVNMDEETYIVARMWSFRGTAIVCVVVITILNCMSVKWAARVQTIFTGAKLLGLSIIIIGGIVKLCQGHVENLKPDFVHSAGPGQIAGAFYGALWAYNGWNSLNYVMEELENPFVNLPRAIIIGVPLVMIVYLLTNIAYFSVMTLPELVASEAVAVTFGERVLGNFVWIIPLSVAFSTFGTANGGTFTAGRITFSAAREHHMVQILSYVHVKSLAPTPGLLLNAFVAILMILGGDINQLINFFSFTAWIFYGLAMVALLIMRRTRKDVERPYRVTTIFPILVMIISVYLVVAPIIDDPALEYLYAVGFIVLGVCFYTPFVFYKLTFPGTDRATRFVQRLLNVAPTHGSSVSLSTTESDPAK